MIEQLFEHFRPSDLLDIAAVAAILFGLLVWLRQAAPRRMALVAAVLLGLVLVTRLAGMLLTELLLEGLLIVLTVAAILIFHQDLRRVVNRLAEWHWWKRSPPNGPARVLPRLATAVQHLAEQRTGALIALRGWESWGESVSGGVPLDGEVSEPLLYSIFHAGSPGHDGAVLIENDRIVRFGVHLPLTTRPEMLGWGGTRHAAALGLSERRDALVVVVSEERGTVSIAERGRLEPIENAAALRARLESFWRYHHGGRRQRSGAWLSRQAATAAIALALAVSLWFVFAFQYEPVRRTLRAPIELRNLPDGWALDDPVPAEAWVTISGREQAFQLWDSSDLVVPLDLSDIHDGINVLALEPEEIDVRTGLEVERVEPEVVVIDARPRDPPTQPTP